MQTESLPPNSDHFIEQWLFISFIHPGLQTRFQPWSPLLYASPWQSHVVPASIISSVQITLHSAGLSKYTELKLVSIRVVEREVKGKALASSPGRWGHPEQTGAALACHPRRTCAGTRCPSLPPGWGHWQLLSSSLKQILTSVATLGNPAVSC